MKALPSRLKVALHSAAISGAVLGILGLGMWLFIHRMQMDAMDREIRTLASRHPGLFSGRGSYERLASSLQFTFGDDYTNNVILLVRDSEGRVMHMSPHWPAGLTGRLGGVVEVPSMGSRSSPAAATGYGPRALQEGRGPGRGGGFGMGRGGPQPDVLFTNEAKFFSASSGQAAWRLGVLGNDAVTIVLGLNERETARNLDRIRNAFLLAIPLALMLVGGGGWVVAGRALRPLNMIAETAERVTARGLDQRIPDCPGNPEASRVIRILNGMMDRLEASFHQATRFSADASHELKTPLAVIQGELENAVQAAVPGSGEQQFFSNLLEEIQRLKTITRSLLLLAQADAGQLKLARDTVDLSGAVESMVEDARALGGELRLSVDARIEAGVHIEADAPLLYTALFNLVSNAVKYNEPGGKLSVRLESKGTRRLIEIGNSGPGIPAADQVKIFDRFYRVSCNSRAQADGIGLGLSLAREIIRAHGGELILKESRPGWTSFEMTLAEAR